MGSLMISTPLYTTLLSQSPPLSSSKSSFFTPTNATLSSNHKTYGSLQVSRRGNKSMGCRCLFGLGVPELVVIAGVSALLFGPKNLPDIGRSIGKTVKSFQQGVGGFGFPSSKYIDELAQKKKKTIFDEERQLPMETGAKQPLPVCLGGANTVLNLEPESSVSVSYHPLFGPHDDLILLELDDKLIPDVLSHKVSLRGETDEEAVLCTQSKTYAVKFVGTSNSVLLIPPLDQSQHYSEDNADSKFTAPVMKVSPGVLEIVEVAPRLDKLKMLLSENPYRFDEMLIEDELDRTRRKNYKWDDLIENIQASEDELRSGLEAISAVEINNYWRIVDEDYMTRILKMLLHNSVLNDWSLSELNESEAIGVLQSDGFPYVLARHCLCTYGFKLDEGIWRLDKKKVCVQFAREILRGGKMNMEKFMVELMRKVPEEMGTRFDTLEGEVVTEKIGVETLVYAFSVSSLPSSPAERFSVLFRERPKWEWKDLQPYIRDLSVPGLSAEGLLLKYTRRTQPTADAEPVFSAR